MNNNLQEIILNNILHNEKYCRSVIPHLQKEYFTDEYYAVFDLFCEFVYKYNKMPNSIVLEVELKNSDYAKKSNASEILSVIQNLDDYKPVNDDWLLEQTEKWCKDRSVFNAIMSSIDIIEERDTKHSQDAIPDILSEALNVGFDNRVGHDYFENSKERYEYYNQQEDKIPFDLEKMNDITCGGVTKKSLNMIMSSTGGGKSLAMCHFAANAISQGYNVLYVTMEMAEEKIAERIDANLMDEDILNIPDLTQSDYEKKMTNLFSKISGKLIIKEYPTGLAHVGHFRALLKELNTKKSFSPDIIFVDYLNICASSRMKMGNNVGSYHLIKSIAEELRGLAVEYDLPIFSATQVNRTGVENSDVEMTDTSDSFGIPFSSDLLLALITNENLEKLNQVMIKQLKNRYNDLNSNKKFVVGIDRPKMRLYDVENSAQNLSDGGNSNSNTPPKGPIKRSYKELKVE